MLRKEIRHDVVPQDDERNELMVHVNRMLTDRWLLSLACLYLTKI
jgi:hypothetical protein